MWLSKRIVQETPEFEPATLGTVSIGGEDAAVVTDGEKRHARVISPGGYCWQPGEQDSVLVIKGNELYVEGDSAEMNQMIVAVEIIDPKSGERKLAWEC